MSRLTQTQLTQLYADAARIAERYVDLFPFIDLVSAAEDWVRENPNEAHTLILAIYRLLKDRIEE